MDVEAASQLGSDTSPVLAGSVGALPDAKPALASHMVQLELHFAPVRGVIVHGGLVSRMAPEEVKAARWSAVGGLRDPHVGAQ